jgi:hypothetical protein
MVLALKNGVPVVAIDPVAGGGKIRRQAETLGWPIVFEADSVDDRALEEAFDWCLSAGAQQNAVRCAESATRVLDQAKSEFVAALASRGRAFQKGLE